MDHVLAGDVKVEVERRSLRIFFSDSRFRTHVVATTVCATGRCIHTPCRTCSLHLSLRDVQTRTRMAPGVCSSHVISLTLSILMFHPPSLLFPHGHFVTSFPSVPSLPNCSRSESACQGHFRTSGEEFGYLADPTYSTPLA